jgi:hypothetical protein
MGINIFWKDSVIDPGILNFNKDFGKNTWHLPYCTFFKSLAIAQKSPRVNDAVFTWSCNQIVLKYPNDETYKPVFLDFGLFHRVPRKKRGKAGYGTIGLCAHDHG